MERCGIRARHRRRRHVQVEGVEVVVRRADVGHRVGHSRRGKDGADSGPGPERRAGAAARGGEGASGAADDRLEPLFRTSSNFQDHLVAGSVFPDRSLHSSRIQIGGDRRCVDRDDLIVRAETYALGFAP